MNKVKRNTTLILLAFYMFILLAVNIINKEMIGIVGGYGFFGGIVLFILGIFLSAFKVPNNIVNGFFIAGLLIAAIGFGVCSANFKW